MRKKVLLAAAAVSLVLLTGCMGETYPLTEEEQDMIAEYAAGVLLRNDESYTQALVTPTPTPSPEPTLTPTPEPTVMGGTDETGGSHKGNGNGNTVTENAALDEVYGLEGLLVEYDGYEVLDSVMEENGTDTYVVPAEDGKMLLKVNFILTNTAGIEQSFDFGVQDIRYQLDCNERRFLQPKITGLSQDMLFRKITLSAGESSKGCVIFDISLKADAKDCNVIVSRGDRTSILALDK